jgi:hypothetical protein
MKRIELLALNTWSKALWTDEMHPRCREDQITSDRENLSGHRLMIKTRAERACGSSFRSRRPFQRPGPILERHLAARAAKGKVRCFDLKLEVAESEKLAARWRGRSFCANESELQLQYCASHFRTTPVPCDGWALFMPYRSAPTLSSAMDLWVLVSSWAVGSVCNRPARPVKCLGGAFPFLRHAH